MPKFTNIIGIPFANTGDKMNIPNTAEDGSINWTDGFSDKYQLPIEDGGLYIPRSGVNAVFYLSQAAIKELQEKVPLSVNGVLPDTDGNIALQVIELTSLITNADGIYQKYEGNSITWGNSDFSTKYSQIFGTVKGLSILSNLAVGRTATDYQLSINGDMTIKGNILFVNENFGTVANLSIRPNGGLVCYSPIQIASLGVATAPDSAYALKVQGNSMFSGRMGIGTQVDANYGLVSAWPIKVSQVMYSTGDYGAYTDFNSSGKYLRMVVYPANGNFGLFQLNAERLSAHFYNMVGGVGINTDPDSAYTLKVGGNSSFNGNIRCFSELYIENRNAQSFPQLVINSSAQSWGLVLYPDGNNLGIHDYTGGGSDPCSFNASGTTFNKKVGILTSPDSSYALKVGGHTNITGNLRVSGTISGTINNTPLGKTGYQPAVYIKETLSAQDVANRLGLNSADWRIGLVPIIYSSSALANLGVYASSDRIAFDVALFGLLYDGTEATTKVCWGIILPNGQVVVKWKWGTVNTAVVPINIYARLNSN